MTDTANRIMQGLSEASAHAKGEEVPNLALRIPAQLDVPTIRHRTGLSQAAFSRRVGVSPATLRNWEQSRRHPEGPARILLAMLERNPQIVEEALERKWTPCQILNITLLAVTHNKTLHLVIYAFSEFIRFFLHFVCCRHIGV